VLEVTGASVVRFGAADSESEPLWRALIAHAAVSLASASLRLPAPAAIQSNHPGDWVLRAGLLERQLEAKSTWVWDRRGGWRLIAISRSNSSTTLFGRWKRTVFGDRPPSVQGLLRRYEQPIIASLADRLSSVYAHSGYARR
jgi:hypothetical protein